MITKRKTTKTVGGSLCAIVALLFLVGHTGQCPPNDPSKYGVGGRGIGKAGPPEANIIDKAVNGGFRWVRMSVSFTELVPCEFQSECPNAYNAGPLAWNWYQDNLVEAYHQKGLSILMVVTGNPTWNKRQPPYEPCDKESFDGAFPPEDAFVLRKIAREVAARYGDRVAAFEIWNEPNHCRRWRGTPGEYRRQVLPKIFDGIKAVRPFATVVAPALGNHQDPALGGPMDFAKWVMKNGALIRPIDYVSFHRYHDAENVKSLMQQAAGFHACYPNSPLCVKGFWLTEFGFRKKTCETLNSVPDPGGKAVEIYQFCDSKSRCGRVFYHRLWHHTCADDSECANALLWCDGTAKGRYWIIRDYLLGL